jgi:hypothetical protein
MAVSLSLCSEFADEVLASDGVSEPWLVWEWYVVEGMVRTLGRTPDDSRLPSVKLACKRLPQMFNKVMDSLEPFGEALRFQQGFASLADDGTAIQWIERLMQHHRNTQQQKPPDGKNSWLERFDDGTYVIRPLYLRDGPATRADSYVHFFRTNPLWSFAHDLRLVRT